MAERIKHQEQCPANTCQSFLSTTARQYSFLPCRTGAVLKEDMQIFCTVLQKLGLFKHVSKIKDVVHSRKIL